MEFASCPVGVNVARTEVVDFSKNVYNTQFKIMYPRPVIEPNWIGFMSPYSLYVSFNYYHCNIYVYRQIIKNKGTFERK